MIAISESQPAEAWVRLALRLLPENGEIYLRGMITIDKDRSLSEGALRAQQLRDRFDDLIATYPMLRSDKWVRVDYDPFSRVISELHDFPVDLVLAEWHGPKIMTGGIKTADILERVPCDIALISGKGWEKDGPVLATLHGGPNLTLAVRLAKALTPNSPISLFHAVDSQEDITKLHPLLGAEGGVSRLISVRSDSDLKAGILHEITGHKLIVMGSTFFKSINSAYVSGDMVKAVFENVNVPVILVREWSPTKERVYVPEFVPIREEDISTRVDRWFAENSFNDEEFSDMDLLMRWKEQQGVTISVGLPALNEEETVGNVLDTIKKHLMDDVPLIDDIAVVDGGSQDKTVQIVEERGLPVYLASELLTEVGFIPGKGEALWKSLHVLNGDIIAWIDTDIKNIHPRFVYGIIGPLLRNPKIQYVKGFYRRPINVGGQMQAYGGGRVTELVVRPLFNLFYPELSGFVQPLAGEYAGRRSALERVPFFSGYGVETGLLIDLHDLFGLDGLAQTNLQERVHHNQPLGNLSRMSFAILQVFITRLEDRYGLQLLELTNPTMKTIMQAPGQLALDVNEITDTARPPMLEVVEYMKKHHPVDEDMSLPGD
jgi:glucosyl-3-phosphoglycerate synthase